VADSEITHERSTEHSLSKEEDRTLHIFGLIIYEEWKMKYKLRKNNTEGHSTTDEEKTNKSHTRLSLSRLMTSDK
jgi:hypothetical protein